MTTPRSIQIDLSVTNYYHCMSRCVRRAYLCGDDAVSGKNFDHRKQWLVDKIKELAAIFYIKIAAFAVMDNHYHLVLHVDSRKASTANDSEILKRWEAIFPINAKKAQGVYTSREALSKRIEIWRHRFSNISWFMKVLNEHMARLANEEDGCEGRFWQGRFKSQALLDEAAILAAMVYVDLNPIRAKIAITPESSMFTSIYERIKTVSAQMKGKMDDTVQEKINNCKQPKDLMPFYGYSDSKDAMGIPCKLADYIQLVETTGRIIRCDKKGAIPKGLLPIFERINLEFSGWMSLVSNLEYDFCFAVGSPELLSVFGRSGKHTRKKSPKGYSYAKQCYRKAA